ncbi:MAG TPA: hypothetical protein VGN34_25395 [Ktedonobacteraceae bacterium]|jgi:hypothetical protein
MYDRWLNRLTVKQLAVLFFVLLACISIVIGTVAFAFGLSLLWAALIACAVFVGVCLYCGLSVLVQAILKVRAR